MAATVIKNFIAKALFKKKGAIANNKAVEFSSNALEQRIKNFGIDPNAIQNENELNQILSAVKQAEDAAFSQRFGDMLGGSKFDRQGEVFDMTGKKLDSSRGIMGGTQIDEKSLKEGLMKTDNPFSDLVKTTDQGPKTLKQREAEVLARMNRENKEAAQRIRNRKMVDEAIDNASPGFAGDRKYDAQLVADDLAEKRFGKDFYDLDQRQQMDLYDESFQGLSDSRFKNKPDPEDMADGGRIGLKAGMTKRAFMKLMGGVGLGIGALKTGLLGLGKGAGKQVAKEVVQQSTTTPPPYFFELANKIKKFGTDTTPTNDRTIAKAMKSKDGKSDYILEEDITSGDTIIKKINNEGDDMISDVQIMEFRKGEDVITKDGKAIKTPNEYEEVTETNSRIYKDNYNASDYTDGIEEIEIKKIIDEASEQAPSIKKAGGGIARMLGE